MAAIKHLGGERFAIDVFLHASESPTGETLRHRSRHKLSDGLRAAKALAAEIEAALRKDGKWSPSGETLPVGQTVRTAKGLPPSEEGTLKAALARAWSDRDHGWSGTRDGRKQHRNAQFVVDFLGETRLCSGIESADFADFRQHELEVEGNSEATVTRKLQAFYRVLWHAEEAGWIKARPKFKRRKLNNARLFTFSPELEAETVALLRAVDAGDMDVPDAVVLGVETGMRLGEIITLEPRRVDLPRSVALIPDALAKNGSFRQVVLTDRAKDILKGRVKAGSLVFPFLTHSKVGDKMQWAREKLGQSGEFVFHATRHTCGTRLAAAGWQVPAIMDQLGHKTPTMAIRYIHLAANDRKKLFAQMGALTL